MLAGYGQEGAGPGVNQPSSKRFAVMATNSLRLQIVRVMFERCWTDCYTTAMCSTSGGELQAQVETPGGAVPIATASRRFAGGGRRQLRGLTKSQIGTTSRGRTGRDRRPETQPWRCFYMTIQRQVVGDVGQVAGWPAGEPRRPSSFIIYHHAPGMPNSAHG